MSKRVGAVAVSTETGAGGTLVHVRQGMRRHAPLRLPLVGPEVGGTRLVTPEAGDVAVHAPLVKPEVGDVAVHAPKRVGVLLYAPLGLQPREP